MLKQRTSRNNRHQPQDPVKEMEQFYLNQYYRTVSNNSAPMQHPSHPFPIHNKMGVHNSTVNPYQIQELERRISQIEQYLGFHNR